MLSTRTMFQISLNSKNSSRGSKSLTFVPQANETQVAATTDAILAFLDMFVTQSKKKLLRHSTYSARELRYNKVLW